MYCTWYSSFVRRRGEGGGGGTVRKRGIVGIKATEESRFHDHVIPGMLVARVCEAEQQTQDI